MGITYNRFWTQRETVLKGMNAKSEILKRKRKVEGRGRGRERKRKGKKEEGKGWKGNWKWSLAETEKIANAPAGNRTRNPSKRGWCSTIEPPRQATSPAGLFEISNNPAGDVACLSGSMIEHQPRLLEKRFFFRLTITYRISVTQLPWGLFF